MLRILHDAGEVWATAVEDGEWWDRPAKPFHAVFQTSGDATRLRDEWASHHAAVIDVLDAVASTGL